MVAIAIMAWIWYDAKRSGLEASARVSLGGFGRVLVDALIPLGLPVIIFGGILGGVVTPTEAAVIAVFYAAIVGIFVYRAIRWRDLPGILVQSAVVTATVCFLLGTAAVVAWILVIENVPILLLNAMTAVPGGSPGCPGGRPSGDQESRHRGPTSLTRRGGGGHHTRCAEVAELADAHV